MRGPAPPPPQRRASKGSAIARRRYHTKDLKPDLMPRNHAIRHREVHLIDEHDRPVGLVETRDALQRARDAGLDLVEFPTADGRPLCRILDYGRYRYEQDRKRRKARSKARTPELKEIRFGRSLRIEQHDIDCRVAQATRFLEAGHQVRLIQRLKRRERFRREEAVQRLRDITASLESAGRPSGDPRVSPHEVAVLLVPRPTARSTPDPR